MVRSVLLKCMMCRRYQGGPYKMPKMMSWPLKKVTIYAPFTYSGCDYIGSMYVKNETNRKQVWLELFTRILIRAVNLEVVEDMSPEKFLLALRRFIARRGKPDEIVLDNASQFKVTKMMMDKTWTEVVKDPDVYS